ncbi:amidohydrolase family protein [Microbacterium sp. MAHUQ-60]|uniref:amidohydrolase family protein n=1 Tax=unclassified Microbacterium TaxID=2609290 RepID=UPI00360DBBA5
MPDAQQQMIDAHVHVMDPSRFEYEWATGRLEGLAARATPESLLVAMADTPVRSVIAVQALQATAETEWLLELAASSASPVIAVVGWTDLTAAEAPQEIARLVADQNALVGFRHPAHMEAERDWLSRPVVGTAVRAMGEVGAVFDLIVERDQTDVALALVDACPDTRFVIDHGLIPDIAAGEWDGWVDALRRFVARDNVWCKLSAWHGAVGGDPAVRYAEETLRVFGASRSMFGTDWPVSTALRSYQESVGIAERVLAGASASERAAVLSATARAVYRIT